MKKEKGIAKRYFGGKGASGAIQKIINCIRPHDTYIEPFLGNGQVMRSIKKSQWMIGNDLNKEVYQKWKDLNYDWLKLYNLPALDLLSILNLESEGRTVIYLDPPYPLDSRKNSRLVYDHEMTNQDHIELLDYICNNLPKDVDVLISTYPNDLYESMLYKWSKIEFQVKTSHGMATEVLYYNYTDLSLLHDHRFAGDNYRERLQIKRKTKRWVKRLQSMPDYERQAILEEILKFPEFSAVASKAALQDLATE